MNSIALALGTTRIVSGLADLTSIFTTPGAGSYLVPPGYNTLIAEVWGGGGAGAGGSDPLSDGGGGSGYSRAVFKVTNGQTIYYNVGSGGAGTSSAGGNGTDSWVNPSANSAPSYSSTNWNTIGAVGGGGFGSNNAVGARGVGSVGDISWHGGAGGPATGGTGGGGGGSAGSNANGTASSNASGGAGGTPDGSNGADGTVGTTATTPSPGGGGGGAWSVTSGNGGTGKVKLTVVASSLYLPTRTFDTSSYSVGGGKLFDAKRASNGNLIWACGRHATASKVGICEADLHGNELFFYSDAGWAVDGSSVPAGPESVHRYSNGNYLVASVDGGRGNLGYSVFEINQSKSLVWGWNYNAVADAGTNRADPETINGIECVVIYGTGVSTRRGVTIIRRDNQATLLDLPDLASAAEINGGCFRSIGGRNTLLVLNWNDVTGYEVTFDGSFANVSTTSYNIGDLVNPAQNGSNGQSPGSGWDAKYLNDNEALVACGFNGAIARIQLRPTLAKVWQSVIFSQDSGVATPATSVNLLPGKLSECLVATRSNSGAPGIIYQTAYGP